MLFIVVVVRCVFIKLCIGEGTAMCSASGSAVAVNSQVVVVVFVVGVSDLLPLLLPLC